MADFLLELLSEEIPARMQEKARGDLARLFEGELAKAGLKAGAIETFSTPRRLALIARGLPDQTEAVSEELKGPRTSAPPQALEGFLRKTGLTQDQLTDRDGVWFAVVDKPGRATAEVLAEAIPAIVRAFPWPKSMRWGAASLLTESLRWVRPLQGIVALLGGEVVHFEIDGIASGAETVGHRFHHPGRITIGSAEDYAAKLRACHVIVDQAERESLIATAAADAAATAGLTLVRDDALLRENAGLTEWPVPLLGSFDPAYLEVPPEVIQLTMATNQKYFAVVQSSPARGGRPAQPVEGAPGNVPAAGPLHHQPAADGPPPRAGEDLVLAPNFVCTANIEARDGGAAIVAGNQKVLAARLSDAKFFWEQDLKVPLEEQAKKLSQIVFHEKLGTVADKVERVAELARWLVKEGIVGGANPSSATISDRPERSRGASDTDSETPSTSLGTSDDLAQLAYDAARLCKADLVTGMVGEFPELQGVMGGYYARAQGHPDAVADAIRDHYKPVGQGDEVPTAPVTVAVSLADKLDSIVGFFGIGQKPTGSKDPFALRRSALSVNSLIQRSQTALRLRKTLLEAFRIYLVQEQARIKAAKAKLEVQEGAIIQVAKIAEAVPEGISPYIKFDTTLLQIPPFSSSLAERADAVDFDRFLAELLDFFADRLKVQQREAGVRHDLIDAVFALGGEDDLVRLLARVRALQSFVETPEGRDLLAGYKRAANILKKEGWPLQPSPFRGEGRPRSGQGEGQSEAVLDSAPLPAAASPRHPLPGGERVDKTPSYTPEPEEQALAAALDAAEPRARAAVAAEDFEGAMAALASLRGPVDAFFEKVTVNDADPAKREARLNLLARMRDAVHQVADFSRIEG